MAQRYGRKQKRAHRAKIAELTTRLGYESTAHMYLPSEGVPELTSYARVLDYRVTEDGSPAEVVYRSAYVTVAAPCNDLMEMMHDRTKVQFMGHQYIIANGSYQPGMECERVELELEGVT